MQTDPPIKVTIIGGSVCGVACAHALLQAGNCLVTVYERASSISAAGAVCVFSSRQPMLSLQLVYSPSIMHEA